MRGRRFFERFTMPEGMVLFALFWILSAFCFWHPLSSLVSLSLQNDQYSHLALTPLLSLFLIYLERSKIFLDLRRSWGATTILVFAGAGFSFLAREAGNLSIAASAIAFAWIAWFAASFGIQACRNASFALLFLMLMIPFPSALLERIIVILQHASAQTAYVLFKLTGVPVLREGLSFTLPGVEIKVAEECSGVRSTVALVITGLLAGHLFLRSGWRKLSLSLLTVPIAIFKNGVRIAAISLLGVYANSGFLYGRLHRYGGLPFSMLALAMLLPFIVLLRNSELGVAGEEQEGSLTLAARST